MAFDLSFTNNGIIQPSASSIRSGLEQMFVSIWGNKINLDPSSKQGQLITSLTTIILEKNSKIAKALQSFDPKTAENDAESGLYWQDAIGDIYGMERKQATHTSVLCNITGRKYTVIPADAKVISDNGDIFQISQSVTIPLSGGISVYFNAVEGGAIPADAGSINTIYTPVVGWDTVSNTSSGVIGVDFESREAFEMRRIALLAKNSTNQVDSIRSELEQVEDVLRYRVEENDTDDVSRIQDVNVDPHCVYCIVENGDINEIGAAIRRKKSGGCSTMGNQEYNDEYGTIYFDRPTLVPIEVEVTAVEMENTPSNIVDQIKDILVENMSAGHTDSIKIGENVYVGRFYKALSGLDVSLQDIELSINGGAQALHLDMKLNMVATLDASDITVNIVSA